MKITNKQIKDALKGNCQHITVNSDWISTGSATSAQRNEIKVWVKENLGLEPSSEWYVNRSYCAHFDRVKKG